MSDEQARAHFAVGKSLYEAGRFTEAGQEWEQAYELSGRVELLYNCYVAYREAADTERALSALRRYLENAQIQVRDRHNLEARVGAMEAQLAEAATGEQSAADGEPSSDGETPPLAAGDGASAPAVSATKASEPSPSSASPSTSSGGSVVPWLLVGIGGALAVSGLVTGAFALGKKGDVEEACPVMQCEADYDLEGERDSAKGLALAADVLVIGGLGVAATGMILWWLEGESEPNVANGPHAGFGCSPGGCAASLHGRF
ncbi:MAG: hypothetical protein OEZ06_16505 [Myxococcales bacterium]|nr:hypothetical protein [Myxococcales bacterium]